jgi:hypothetical protein
MKIKSKISKKNFELSGSKIPSFGGVWGGSVL